MWIAANANELTVRINFATGARWQIEQLTGGAFILRYYPPFSNEALETIGLVDLISAQNAATLLDSILNTKMLS